MKTITKLLKITGTLCLSCICLISKADPKILTLEELRKLLDRKCAENTKTLEAIRTKIETGNQKGFNPTYKKAENSYSYDVPKEFSENFKGITRVEYNANGEPTVIETVNGWEPEVSEALQFISCENTPFRQYIGEQFSEKTSAKCLDNISKELTAKELETRGVTDADMKKYGIASVREITFDSILSGFFNKEEASRARAWFSHSEELDKAIDAYVNKAMFLKSVTYLRKETCIDLVTETSPNDSAFKIREKAQPLNEYKADFVYEVCGEWREKMKEILANGLKNLLRYKNGKEKVILLLLLDEKTRSGFKLKWVHEDGRYGEYYGYKNLILSDFKTIGLKFLSHEIGHYLQMHLGLDKDLKTYSEFQQYLKGYQTVFAKELLLLKPGNTETNEKIHIPSGVQCDISDFYFNPHLFDSKICFNEFSEKDLFFHWQLASRWSNSHEVSNMLGIYFSAKTIYVCALSDIRELKSVRYGHASRNTSYRYLKNPNGEYWQKFETSEAQTVFENIVAEAAEQKPSVDVLKFLCRLHKRPWDENKVVNLFDYDEEGFLAQYLPYLRDFKAADE